MKSSTNVIIRKYVTIAILVSLAVVLSLFDRYISQAIMGLFPFSALVPNFKIGIANIVILIIIYNYEFKSSLMAVLLKSTVLGLFAIFGLTSFMIGFTGTILSYFVMYLLKKVNKSSWFMIFVSMIGGFMHSLGQVCASLLFYNVLALNTVLLYAPIFLVIGLFSGLLVGLITFKLNDVIIKHDLLKTKRGN